MDYLNPEQKQAVEHVEGPLLVLAGAGSGKTRVVTHRIAHLLDLGILPSDILAVTFTNKAADEMRSRIRTLKNAQVLTCTFHSLGARILRESIHALEYKNDFIIYDEEDSEKILKNCLVSLQMPSDSSTLRMYRHLISTAKNDLKTPQQTDETLSPVYLCYMQRLKECNALDFDDLLYLTVRLFKEDAHARSYYQAKWLFVLIDEYQDTNLAQYTLAKMLVDRHKNIFAVGDPDQSIYSWRGALYQNILNFEIDFPGARVITLDQNYRSTNHILKGANALIDHNEERYQKKLWSGLGEGEKIGIFVGQTEKEEAYFVSQKILDHISSYSLNDMAILYRTNAQSRAFEDALLALKISYQIIGGLSFYQRKEIKDILAYLKMLLSDLDWVSFVRTVNLPKRGLGHTTLEKIIQGAQNLGTPIFSFCEEILHQGNFLGKNQNSGLQSYVDLIHGLRAQKGDLALHELIEEIIALTKYLSYLEEDPESVQDRKENLDELVRKAMEWQEENPNGSLSLFLEELSLRSGGAEIMGPKVKLMTLHNSKGLEFDLVFLVGLEEDLFPHINSKNDPKAIEEERRLCYVGMTRAKRQLYLCSSIKRYMWGTAHLMHPSRFLKEIPSEHLENFSKPTLHLEKNESSQLGHFAPGDQVLHQEFGMGIIQKIGQNSLGLIYEVYFPKSSTSRTLVAKYAKLTQYPL